MAATSNLTAGGSMFVPRVTVSTYQPSSQPPSLDSLQVDMWMRTTLLTTTLFTYSFSQTVFLFILFFN